MEKERIKFILSLFNQNYQERIRSFFNDSLFIKAHGNREENYHASGRIAASNPEISDYDFDMKLKELQELEEKHPEFNDPNSPTQRVGGAVTKNFATIVHEYRMYSLSNSYSKEYVFAF